MNDEALEALKALGAQKVHEETHISRKNIEAILNRSFEGIHRVQFAGFVSILEREYGLDLAALKEEFNAQWKASHAQESFESDAEPERDAAGKGRGNRGVLLGVLFVAGVLAFWFLAPKESSDSQLKTPETPPQEHSVVEPAVQTPLAVIEEAVPEAPQSEEKALPPTLSIIPKTKLWMGFIDLETFARTQELTTEAVTLDTNRSWLMIFGHGHFKVVQGDETLDFSNDNRLRFIYEDGVLREITRVEFKERNRGQNW